ncbi:uncharacterized protein HMPREF1541_05679 [Cyphellophora europaea CBS 101466]|uniref:Phytanoyl-CoA dioxygenase n=1 Tax=Cyphellophora europaea (strain CBS 101466) TaxID=1220924 RepID=W2RSH4_CYPE1|nr:uncharacterized protein HMPREF1541_05679 [Cyphellophora europaea CBS 101466]ETN39456.1 hypothetical protein HMPREF1541_05679 [Cyphellophora europaea CBS 101466]
MSSTPLPALRFCALRLGKNPGAGLLRPSRHRARYYSRLHRTEPATKIADSLKQDGFVVIQSLFSADQVRHLNADMDSVLSRSTPGKIAAKVSGSSIPEDEAVQRAIFGANTRRVDKLLAHSETWRTLVDDDALHGICAQALGATGDYWLSTAQMIEIGPGSAEGPLHPDAGLWWMLLGLDDEAAPELVLNFLVATTRTTVANGATGVVEGSHKLPISKVLADMEAEIWKTPSERVEQVELEAGDCLLVGGRIFHRGGANTTADEYRRVLSCMVTSCALTPEEAPPFYVGEDVARGFSRRARKFLGYEDMRPAMGAGFWRR